MLYLDIPYQEAISENNQIKDQNETVKLLDKEGRMRQQKYVKPWWWTEKNYKQQTFFKIKIVCFIEQQH